jgi:hypothetical protein
MLSGSLGLNEQRETINYLEDVHYDETDAKTFTTLHTRERLALVHGWLCQRLGCETDDFLLSTAAMSLATANGDE